MPRAIVGADPHYLTVIEFRSTAQRLTMIWRSRSSFTISFFAIWNVKHFLPLNFQSVKRWLFAMCPQVSTERIHSRSNGMNHFTILECLTNSWAYILWLLILSWSKIYTKYFWALTFIQFTTVVHSSSWVCTVYLSKQFDIFGWLIYLLTSMTISIVVIHH